MRLEPRLDPWAVTALGAVLLMLVCAPGGAGQAQPAAPKPEEARTVSANGIELYYESFGRGEPLLLLHGFGGCGRMWSPFVTNMAKNFRVIVPDLRGHGRSTNPAGGFTHRQAAKDIFALLDGIGLTEVRAMGISTGGMTLLHMATSQPQRIESMVLIGATHYFPEEARAIMRKEADAVTSPEAQNYYRRCASRGDAQVKQLIQEFSAFQDSYDDMNFTAPFLGTIRARTLIVHGDRDEFFPVPIPVEMYRSIPRSQLWIVPGGDHVPIFGTWARAFEETASAFLRKGNASQGARNF